MTLIGLVLLASAPAAEPTAPETLFRTGKYDEAARAAAAEVASGRAGEASFAWKARAEAARGKFDAAAKTLADARRRSPYSLVLPLLGYEIARAGGREADAAAAAAVVGEQLRGRGGRADFPAERVMLGRFLLARGADAKEILDQYFNAVVKKQPEFVDAYFAAAELALGKNDRALAVETLQKAPKEAATDPRYHYLLARAFADDDRERSAKAVDAALAVNPHHVDSLLMLADARFDAEDYPGAKTVLQRVFDVDPGEARAWAYRAVAAHLTGDGPGETAARDAALKRWPANPEVEHLIGRKLSRNYRFAEGAAHQRKALEKDSTYLPAKVQLCQDLLRLGDEAEGWKLAAEVFAADGYNVVAFNLVSLRDHLAGFRTIAGDGFLLRMDAKEADIYGPRALAVLRRARQTLAEKYGVKLDKAVTVEVFPRKQDFAVRTFGLPGAEGFLGVCFGPVITANSPASQGKSPSNWEAVLWHEFCHTVTLTKTRNTMPRWLSEGISVYEETRADPAWGQWLTPRYRAMILGDDLTPVSKLSSAFLNPKSAVHVQFAYFESAMVVEYLIEKHGFDAVKGLLADLGSGLSINEALERQTGGPVADLDREFSAYARKKATDTAGTATWEKFDLEDGDSAAVRAWLDKHPRNFWGMQRLAARLIKEGKWADAALAASDLRAVYPEYVGPDNAYEILAAVHRQAHDQAKEAAALDELAKRDGDAVAAYSRLVELGENAGDWSSVRKNARRWLAVNPLTPAPHRALAKAAEKLDDRAEAVAAYRAVLAFGVPDAADVHYRLAVLHAKAGERNVAKREVLKALEDAPRSSDAHNLLLRLVDEVPAPEKSP
jgi:hypothetical protein